MILEVGTASSGDVAELLGELSSLNRRLGGPGVEFLVNECRTWRVAGSAKRPAPDGIAASNRLGKASHERPVLRGDLCHPPQDQRARCGRQARTPCNIGNRFDGEPGSWSCGSTRARPIISSCREEASTANIPSFVLASDSARRAGDKATAGKPESKTQPGSDASIDALNQHLQKIEELRRKFEREDCHGAGVGPRCCRDFLRKNRRPRPWPKFRSLRAGGVRSASSPRWRSRSEC